jgi:hypothetical protein
MSVVMWLDEPFEAARQTLPNTTLLIITFSPEKLKDEISDPF